MLTVQQKAMIDFACREHFRHAGSLDTAVMELFGMTPARYWREISRLTRTRGRRCLSSSNSQSSIRQAKAPAI
ncbi:DUF3263 domain-containing protein [Arthrobacter sp. 31Cvi3.1E]|uniref:DUF3263 domain-containing protein n=1 Tax=Paenarthrobacter nicotinovorans TaxID=29320 RepID=UPI0015C44207